MMPCQSRRTSLPEFFYLSRFHYLKDIMNPVVTWSSNRVEHDGAPLFYMSAAKPARNMGLIYEAIKDVPDSTVVRADYDQKGASYIFFPKRTTPCKKKNPEKLENLPYYRNEVRKILGDSLSAAKKEQNNSSNKVDARSAEEIKKIATLTPSQGDFTAGQLKPVLKKMAEGRAAWDISQSKKMTEKIHHQRLNSFSLINEKECLLVKSALFGGDSTVSESRQDQSIKAMLKLVTDYIKQANTPAKSMLELIQTSDNKKELLCFAEHWQAAINAGKKASLKNSHRLLQITIFNWTPAISALSDELLKIPNPKKAVTPHKQAKQKAVKKINESIQKKLAIATNSSESSAQTPSKISLLKKSVQPTDQNSPEEKNDSDVVDDFFHYLKDYELPNDENFSGVTAKNYHSGEEGNLSVYSSEFFDANLQVTDEDILNLRDSLAPPSLPVPELSMPAIANLDSYLARSASGTIISGTINTENDARFFNDDRSNSQFLRDLVEDDRDNFPLTEIYKANSAEQKSDQVGPENGTKPIASPATSPSHASVSSPEET
jgi:hypothetical protein